jgi:adenylate cyclase
MAHVTYVDLACARGEVGLAERHAARALRLADESGSPYVRVYAQASRGLAHTVAGRLDDAIDDLGEALSFARERRAGLEVEARILADLAHAHHLRGDLDDAWRVATEAIDVATRRCARVPECLAHAVRAGVRTAQDDLDGAAAAVERAQALLHETGAAIYEPLIRAERERVRVAKVSQPVTQFTSDLGPCPTL